VLGHEARELGGAGGLGVVEGYGEVVFWLV
jgi:hypothetical protein